MASSSKAPKSSAKEEKKKGKKKEKSKEKKEKKSPPGALLGFCLYPINPSRFSNQYCTSADRCTPTLPR